MNILGKYSFDWVDVTVFCSIHGEYCVKIEYDDDGDFDYTMSATSYDAAASFYKSLISNLKEIEAEIYGELK